MIFDRRKSTIAKNVDPNAVENFGQRRRELNFNPREEREVVVPGETPEEFEARRSAERSAASRAVQGNQMAKYIFETGDERMLEYLESLANMHKVAMTTDISDEEKAEHQAQFDYFDGHVKKIRKEVLKLQLEKDLNNISNSINNVLEEQKANFEESIKILGNLEPSSVGNLETITANITQALEGTYISLGASNQPLSTLINNLNAKLEQYNNEFGNEFPVQINYYSDDLIKKYYSIYSLSSQRISEKLKESANNPDNVALANIQTCIDTLIQQLYTVHNNPTKTAEIIEEIDKLRQQAIQQPSEPSNNPTVNDREIEIRKQGLKAILTNKYDEIGNLIKDCVVNFEGSTPDKEARKRQIKEEINQIIEAETVLSDADKKAIANEAYNELFTVRLAETFGAEGIKFILENGFYDEIIEMVTSLKGYTSINDEFKTKYSKFLTDVQVLADEFKSGEVVVTFDEENAKMSIAFNGGTIGTVTGQVVTNEVLKEIKNGALKEPETVEPELNKEESKRNFMAALLEIKNRILTSYDANINQLKVTDEYIKATDELRKLSLTGASTYQLTQDVIEDLIDRSHILQDIVFKYGEGFDDFIQKVMDYYEQLDMTSLSQVEYGTPEFDNAYQALKGKIDSFINNVKGIKDCSSFIDTISFNNESESLTIKYNNPNIPDFTKQIVSQEVLEKMHPVNQPTQPGETREPEQPTQTPENNQPRVVTGNSNGAIPVPPVSTNKQEAVDTYVNIITYYNELVSELSELNAEIESVAVYDLPDNNILKDSIAKEQEAKAKDAKLKETRQELAKYRFEYKNLHKEFIFQAPEVQSLQIAEPRFSKSLENFIAVQDGIALEAEDRIRELCEERENNKTNPTAVEAITSEINTLIEFIESRNSLIGRRLIAEASNKDFDIVSALATRRQEKAERRELLKQAKKGVKITPIEPAQSQKTNSEPEETIIVSGSENVEGSVEKEPTSLVPYQEPEKSLVPYQQPEQSMVVVPTSPRVVRLEIKLRENDIPKVNRENAIVPNVETLSCQIVKNKLKIQFSTELKEKLKDLSAKVSLVNKNNYRERVSVAFDPTQESQELGFADGREITPSDYRIEVRSPNGKGSKLEYIGEIEEVVEQTKSR